MEKGRESRKRDVRPAILVLGCVMLAMLCRQLKPEDTYLWSLCQLPRAYLYMTLYVVWGISLRRRIVNRMSRSVLYTIASLMVFWFFVRSLKYYVFYAPVALRYSWYCYYIPLLTIPALSVIAAMTMGGKETEKIHGWIRRILSVNGLLILFVMSNDVHQLIFRFPSADPETWTDLEYSYGPGFILCMVWVAAGLMMMLGIMIKKCRNPGKKMVWLPFVPMGLFFLWSIANMLRIPFLKVIAGDMTAASCLLIAAVFESCIRCGLIPVNSRYGELFQASGGICAQICDNDLKIRYTSGDAGTLDKERMQEALEHPGMTEAGIRFNSIRVNGGYAFWTEDIRELTEGYEHLREVQEELKDRNRLLKLKYKKEKQRKQVEEKNRLYDLLQSQTTEQFRLVAGYVEELEKCSSQERYRRLLGKIILIGSYLKRRKNLTLLALEQQEISQEELIRSLRESCDSLSLCGIRGNYYVDTGKETLAAEEIFLAYDFFEQVVELLLERGGSFFFRLTDLHGGLRISVHLEGNCPVGTLQEKYPELTVEQEEESEWFLALRIPRKGEKDGSI